MEPTAHCFYVATFVEKALHFGEILPPYRPGVCIHTQVKGGTRRAFMRKCAECRLQVD